MFDAFFLFNNDFDFSNIIRTLFIIKKTLLKYKFYNVYKTTSYNKFNKHFIKLTLYLYSLLSRI